ncbi:MAG: hypothetical protein IJ165_00060, partial [Proteobacteria bacterium]|nr:hypothetical protein [Pseudomonadota bacterium]
MLAQSLRFKLGSSENEVAASRLYDSRHTPFPAKTQGVNLNLFGIGKSRFNAFDIPSPVNLTFSLIEFGNH